MRIIFYWHIIHSSGFHHICNIKCRLDCRYSPQNIFSAKNFNPHKKPISLLNVPICTQGMQRTWWPEAGTIIVTGPYCKIYWNPIYLTYGIQTMKRNHVIVILNKNISAGIILCMCPANERWRYNFVMLSLTGWLHSQNDPCNFE